MRAPGEATGSVALESAIDEMAYACGMDPLAFRLKNYAEVEPISSKPFSSKALRECYRQGAERFGWRHRPLTTAIDKLWKPQAILSLVETYPQHVSKREHAAVVALVAAYKVLRKEAERRKPPDIEAQAKASTP